MEDSFDVIQEKDTDVTGDKVSFTDDGDINSSLQIHSKVTTYSENLDVENIILPEFKKIGRENTIIGLTGVVGEWGILSPIHVMKLEDDDSYMLLSGLRRLFASIRNGEKNIPSIVLDFEDKEEGKEKANIISLMINRSQKFTPKELWEQMQVLEDVNGASPGLMEFLLQMQSGDAMKLKDVMLADDDYSDIKHELMVGILTIESAYKKLTAARKKENRLQKEDGIVLEGAPVTVDDVSDTQQLSVDDVKDLLDMTDTDISEESLDDLNRSSEALGEPTVQDPKNRKPIDPAIKTAVLQRDDFKCRCCGVGGKQWLGILVYHHILPVFLGGPDTEDNGLTLCSNCHVTLHLYSFGKVSVNLDELDEEEQLTFKNIFKYGNIIIEGMKRAKINKDEAYKADSGSRRHLYPGEGLKDNKEAFKQAQ